jgi:hypothetical protein
MQLGEQRFPDTVDNDHSTHFHRLMHAIGACNNASHFPCISSKNYFTDRHIMVQDFEILPSQADHSGVNSFNSQLTIVLDGLSATAAELATSAYVVSHYDIMMELSSGGVTIAV